mmetsp:Transcript_18804/g.21389  ORF Transcript_18804/g.21389 Transcript_18804/m.21389 type:complete len:97 (+) Transcript_18804:1045-1335(+)
MILSPKRAERNRKGKKQRRLTTTVASGLADDMIEVKLGLSDDEYLANDSSLTSVNIVSIVSLGHDSNDLIKPCSSDIDVETTEIIKIRRNTSCWNE